MEKGDEKRKSNGQVAGSQTAEIELFVCSSDTMKRIYVWISGIAQLACQ